MFLFRHLRTGTSSEKETNRAISRSLDFAFQDRSQMLREMSPFKRRPKAGSCRGWPRSTEVSPSPTIGWNFAKTTRVGSTPTPFRTTRHSFVSGTISISISALLNGFCCLSLQLRSWNQILGTSFAYGLTPFSELAKWAKWLKLTWAVLDDDNRPVCQSLIDSDFPIGLTDGSQNYRAIIAAIVGSVLFFVTSVVLAVCAVKVCNKRKRRKIEKCNSSEWT